MKAYYSFKQAYFEQAKDNIFWYKSQAHSCYYFLGGISHRHAEQKNK